MEGALIWNFIEKDLANKSVWRKKIDEYIYNSRTGVIIMAA